MARIGVLISGCGFLDGAEVHESVLTLLALARHGHDVVVIAPDIDQRDVVDHHAGAPVDGASRNLRIEAARIARGEVVTPDDAGELDGLVLPGGFGAAKNLSDFAVNGTGCSVEPGTAELIRSTIAAGKPLGAWCIAPAVVAATLRGEPSVQMTIGTDEGTAAALEGMGAKHVDCAVDDCVVDATHKVVTTPAYMLEGGIAAVARGIDKGVDAFCDLL